MADSDHDIGTDSKSSESSEASITMKADATNEDPCKQENTNNEKREGEFKVCSPTNRPITSTTTNPFAPTINKINNILKPPQLSLNNSNNNKSKSFILSPSRLSTVVKKNDDSNSEKKVQVNGETPKFVPLIQSNSATAVAATPAPTTTTTATAAVTTTSTATNSTPTSSTSLASSFVFGQNLRDRVIVPKETENHNNNNNSSSNSRMDDDDAGVEPEPSTSVINSNGTSTSSSEMLFSSAIKNEKRIENAINKETKSLSETAREYEESRASKRKYEQVEVVTGEEGETNILNITCKLFAFDKGSWQERGRGILRLNDLETDDKQLQSRLVFRSTGNFRLVLNTKIWAEMTVEKASEKSVRFTALDPDGDIKIYLAMASLDEARHLFAEIQSRVQKEMLAQKHKKLHTNPTTTDKE